MGIVRFGLPIDEAMFLKEKLGLKVFVEGGTFTGNTALLAAKFFEKVFTIEKSKEMFLIASQNLSNTANITLLKGDTRENIPKILSENDEILFWLDSHWSGGETYGEGDECPLIEELKIIFSSPKISVILVDDARLFLAPPYRPHEAESWPTIGAIVKAMPENWEMFVYEDVIYLIPESIVVCFKSFLQEKITVQHIKSAKKKGIFTRLIERVGFRP